MRGPAVAIGLPFLLFCGLIAAGFLMPGWLRFITLIALAKGLVVLSLMLLMRAGLVSFGQGLYYGLGAYAAGLGVNLLKVTEALALLALGVAVAGAVAWVLGFLLTRYREIFFAMLSLAFSMILYGLLVKSSALGSTDGFNLPTPTFLGFAFAGTAARHALFVLTASVAFAAALLLHRYLGSTRGYLGEAIRENEIRVEYLGASVRGALHVKYVLSAALAGAGGALTAVATGHIDPDLAYWTTSGEFVFVAILSGTGSVAAPFLGSFVFEMIRTYAFAYSPNTWQMVVGATMLLVIIFMPGGLWSLFRRRPRLVTRS